MKPNPVKIWLATVAYSHSSSRNTRYSYKRSMQDYCKFSETTPEEIQAEYETTDDLLQTQALESNTPMDNKNA